MLDSLPPKKGEKLSQRVNSTFYTCLLHPKKVRRILVVTRAPLFFAKRLSQQVNACFRLHWSKFEAAQSKKQRRITFIRGLLFFAKRLSQQVNVSFQTLWSIFYTWEQLLIPLSFFSQQVNDYIDLHYVNFEFGSRYTGYT